ncbi:hypothetical protein BGW36DRAFT_286162 [Talaromyces proteolyticus]|uniref:Uncharacterized protein n=1 Tax=Talaromyces proteolyticus TaxID=1131652 RepID=A0AAD4L0E6_9EURO|nr:uncharacterized protein BGW36DRAFT_286162 [Talaromyces proteolyticus]KAH8705227.1 hypothetical protein BGW36DRAFT_286162 [Talaromyces proteolyticus]
MRAPLLAPSLLLLATQSQQQSVFKEALRWYDRGLGYIRGTLASATNIPGYEILSIMSAAILMSFFETINSTVDSGYEQHIFGAVTLLEANGPETFTSPEYHDIFLAVRGHAITVSFMTGNPTCLSEEEWLTIPFIGIKKSPSEEINDVLLAIIKLLAQLRTSTVVGVGHSEQVNMQEKVLLNLCYLKAELDRIWNEINHWEIHNMVDAPNTLESHYTYTNASEARIVAMHGYARLIILLLLDKFPSLIPSYPAEIMNENYKESQLTQASASIISAASYLSQFDIGCAYLRMTLPVQLVAQGSPSSVQRNHAIKILRDWFAEKPLKGLAKKALQNITYGDHKLTFQ